MKSLNNFTEKVSPRVEQDTSLASDHDAVGEPVSGKTSEESRRDIHLTVRYKREAMDAKHERALRILAEMLRETMRRHLPS